MDLTCVNDTADRTLAAEFFHEAWLICSVDHSSPYIEQNSAEYAIKQKTSMNNFFFFFFVSHLAIVEADFQ